MDTLPRSFSSTIHDYPNWTECKDFQRVFLNQDSQFSADIKVSKEVDLYVANRLFNEATTMSPSNDEDGGVLSNKGIVTELISRKISIEPFRLASLAVGSYDFTLGRYFYRMKKPDKSNSMAPQEVPIHNIYSQADVESKWQLHEAPLVGEELAQKLDGVRADDRIIWLDPGEMLLCHTCEKIGSKEGYRTEMSCRSSLGRSQVRICSCAGLGDVGFDNIWTLEVESVSPYRIFLIVGRRIGQISFVRTTDTFKEPGFNSYREKGKYDNNANNRLWQPTDMLPKLWKDSYE